MTRTPSSISGLTAILLALLIAVPAALAADPAKKPAGKMLPPATKEQKAAADALRNAGFLAQQIAISDPAMDINFKLAGKPVTDNDLAQLAKIGDLVHSVNLATTDIKDDKLSTVGKLKHLKRLHLENTGTTDAGLAHLKGLGHLEYLNLYGTKVSDKGLDHLAGLSNLKKVFFWQSDVTETGAKKLAEKLPSTFMNLGSDKPVIGPEIKYEVAKAPEPKAEPKADEEMPKEVSYATHIAPLFKASCVGCHGEKKAKARLRLDTLEYIKAGAGREGRKDPVVIAGEVADSEVHVRLTLPKDEDEYMPPPDSDAPQLTDFQVAMVAKWIETGMKK